MISFWISFKFRFVSNNSTDKVVINMDTKFKLQSQAIHNFRELLCLKTHWIVKYKYELLDNLSYYHWDQIIRYFLWIELK